MNFNGQWGYIIDKSSLGKSTFKKVKNAFFYPKLDLFLEQEIFLNI